MREPDLKAPRYRYVPKNTLDCDFIEAFKKKYPQYSEYPDEVLKDTVGKHLKLIPKEVVGNRNGVELMSDLGVIFVGMTPPTKKKHRGIAWAQSVKLGTVVHYKNHETDGKLIKIYYCNKKHKLRFESRHLWAFTAVRPFKIAASAEGLKNWRKYVSMEANHRLLWELFNKKLYKDRMVSKQKKSLVAYSEFDMD